MRNLKCLIVFLLLFLIACPAQAAIRISPERFELKVDQNSREKFLNDSITIQVDGNESVRLKVYADNFDLSENGSIITGLKNIPTNNIIENIRYNPTEFVVLPGQAQKVRFTITNLQKLNNGESRIVLFLEDTKMKTQILQDMGDSGTAKLNIKTRIAIPIYIDKGQVKKSGVIDKLTVENANNKYSYILSVKSTGSSKIRIWGKGQLIKDKALITEFPIESHPVQAGITGLFKGDIPAQNLEQNQDYILRINVSYKDENLKTKTLTTEVPFKATLPKQNNSL